MKTPAASLRPSKSGLRTRGSAGPDSSRAAREKAELAMTPAERLTLALELSDLCAQLAVAGRNAQKERS